MGRSRGEMLREINAHLWAGSKALFLQGTFSLWQPANAATQSVAGNRPSTRRQLILVFSRLERLALPCRKFRYEGVLDNSVGRLNDPSGRNIDTPT